MPLIRAFICPAPPPFVEGYPRRDPSPDCNPLCCRSTHHSLTNCMPIPCPRVPIPCPRAYSMPPPIHTPIPCLLVPGYDPQQHPLLLNGTSRTGETTFTVAPRYSCARHNPKPQTPTHGIPALAILVHARAHVLDPVDPRPWNPSRRLRSQFASLPPPSCLCIGVSPLNPKP